MKYAQLEDRTEEMNRIALRVARQVAEETGTLFAGGLSNLDYSLFQQSEGANSVGSNSKGSSSEAKALYEEQVRWCKEEEVDYIIAETMWGLTDSKIALEAITSAGIPAVVTMGVRNLEKRNGMFITADGVPVPEACKQLLELGATLVGVNCSRGPATMIEVVEQICEVVPPEKVCALPIAYRTTPEEPTWHVLTDKACPRNNPVYPKGFDPFYVSQVEIADFTKQCLELGLRYVGICCGNTGSYTRTMAEAMGKESTLGKYHTKAALAQSRVKKMRSSSALPSPVGEE